MQETKSAASTYGGMAFTLIARLRQQTFRQKSRVTLRLGRETECKNKK